MNVSSSHGRASAFPAPTLHFANGSTPFDVVIATRNRPEALHLSLPLLIAQSERAQRIVVIDSSDNPDPVQQVIAQQGVPIAYEHSARGLTHQRNLGLRHVTAPVVFFPDDDSLCHPGTTEAMMRIYSRDPDHRIAGVCAANAPESPIRTEGYDMQRDHRRAARHMSLRNRVEKRVTDLNPFLALARVLQRPHPVPDWLAQEDAVPVEWMTGFRMSFRTDAIIDDGFEETFRGYGLYEDIDASFKAMRHGLLVGANRARIHHHRFPGGRPDPFNFALMTVLNRAFVMARHSHGHPEARMLRRKTRNYALARMGMLVPKLSSRSARAGFRGTRTALGAIDALFDAPPADLTRTYAALHDRLLT